jgi:hypothetical protein
VPNNVPAPLARALLAMTAIAAADRGSARQSASMLNSAAGSSYAAIPEEPAATSPARRVALIALPVLVLLMLVAGLVAFTGGNDTSGGSSTSGGTASPASTHSPRATRTRTPAAESTSEPSASSEPSFNLPELPKASDVERAVTDKVKEQAKRTLTEKAQDVWTSFTDWLSGLF